MSTTVSFESAPANFIISFDVVSLLKSVPCTLEPAHKKEKKSVCSDAMVHVLGHWLRRTCSPECVCLALEPRATHAVARLYTHTHTHTNYIYIYIYITNSRYSRYSRHSRYSRYSTYSRTSTNPINLLNLLNLIYIYIYTHTHTHTNTHIHIHTLYTYVYILHTYTHTNTHTHTHTHISIYDIDFEHFCCRRCARPGSSCCFWRVLVREWFS